MKTIGHPLLILLSLFSIIGCGQSTYSINQSNKKGLLQNQAIEVVGVKRNYHIYIPDKPTNAAIVILLHGNRGSNNQLLAVKRGKSPYIIWLDIAQRENLILAVPNGTRGSNRHRGWNDCRSDVQTNPKSDDVFFISSLIDFIVKNYDANPAKVYVSGTSNGGHMAMRLAQEIPQKLTAFGAVVAANPVNSKCNDSSIPVSALFMNGTSDPILPFKGGQMASQRGEVQSAGNTIEYWVKRNKTETIPLTTQITAMSGKSSIEKQEYMKGENNTEVVFYKVTNGGHSEPSKQERYRKFYLSIVGNQNTDIEMAEEVWNFFKNKMK